jgi:hypothetical protein
MRSKPQDKHLQQIYIPRHRSSFGRALEATVEGSAVETIFGHVGVRNRTRYPFVDRSFFFSLPLALIDSGLAAQMTGAEFKRYVTLLRIANYQYGNPEIRVSFGELEKLDGLSSRTARDITSRLAERGLIKISRTQPLTVTLVAPSCWPEADYDRPVLGKGRVEIKTQIGPKSWG